MRPATLCKMYGMYEGFRHGEDIQIHRRHKRGKEQPRSARRGKSVRGAILGRDCIVM